MPVLPALSQVVSADQLQNGDLIFARLEASVLGRLIELTDDPFHHMGLVVHLDEPTVIEFTFSGCTSRSVAEFVEHYDYVGVLRLDLSPAERRKIRALALVDLGSQRAYGWDEVLIIGFTALFRERRQRKYSLERGSILTAIEAAVCRRNLGRQRSVICSSFVVRVFHEAGVVLPDAFGPFAPAPRHIAPRFAPTNRDRTMAWPVRAQVALNLALVVGLVARAAFSMMVQGSDADPVPLSGPSDYWRHARAVERFEFASATTRGAAYAADSGFAAAA